MRNIRAELEQNDDSLGAEDAVDRLENAMWWLMDVVGRLTDAEYEMFMELLMERREAAKKGGS